MKKIFNREFLYTSGDGGYLMTSIALSNNRKYHSLFVKSLTGSLDDRYTLLAYLDETVIINAEAVGIEAETFSLYTHKYSSSTTPTGYKNIIDADSYPSVTFRTGKVAIKKEMLLSQESKNLVVKYTFENVKSPVRIQISPILAYRHIDSLATDDVELNQNIDDVKGGICYTPYTNMPPLYMQLDCEYNYVPGIKREYEFYYKEETTRGYSAVEPLIKIGYFCIDIDNDCEIYLSVSLQNVEIDDIANTFIQEKKRLPQFHSALDRLNFAASQFLSVNGENHEIVAGYPWFNSWGRDTFISLPHILLGRGMVTDCKMVIDNLVDKMNNARFINTGKAYNSLDAPLWFFYTLQNLENYVGINDIHDNYFKVMESILNNYLIGIDGFVNVGEDMLLVASKDSLSWMDAVIDGESASPRKSIMVEINALWYNAISYFINIAEKFNNTESVEKWQPIASNLRNSFLKCFWVEEEGYLADSADTVSGGEYSRDMSKRPNQLIATSLPYSMLYKDEVESVISLVEKYLLTPFGIRTLAQDDDKYIGNYIGDVRERDKAYHNGTVWMWLMSHYVKGAFVCRGNSFTEDAKSLFMTLIESIDSYGIGTMPEIFDGDSPFTPRGAVSQAWSVAAAIHIYKMIDEMLEV